MFNERQTGRTTEQLRAAMPNDLMVDSGAQTEGDEAEP